MIDLNDRNNIGYSIKSNTSVIVLIEPAEVAVEPLH